MIKMDFMPVCENCPQLEVTLDSIEFQRLGGEDEYYHTITCEHMSICKIMEEHLKKELKKNGN